MVAIHRVRQTMPAEPGEICRPEIIAPFRSRKSLMIFAGTMLAIVSMHRAG
jgi:hypothetical protein